jgi:hypothetical protein
LALTRTLLEDIATRVHVGIVSNVFTEELERAPNDIRETIRRELQAVEFEFVAENEESRALFEEYVAARIVPIKYQNDLRHVSVATITRADAIVSWNFRHLVNVNTRRAVHAVNVRLGYPMIEIVSPEEV